MYAAEIPQCSGVLSQTPFRPCRSGLFPENESAHALLKVRRLPAS